MDVECSLEALEKSREGHSLPNVSGGGFSRQGNSLFGEFDCVRVQDVRAQHKQLFWLRTLHIHLSMILMVSFCRVVRFRYPHRQHTETLAVGD